MVSPDDERFMRMAIAQARQSVADGQSPFGAVVVKDGEVVCAAHNRVWETTDITAHAEIVALREACRVLGTVDLAGCTVYSSTEPCPMCFSAIHWANADLIVFGTAIEDAEAAGFRELSISNEEMKRQGGSPLLITRGVLRDEAQEAFRDFLAVSEGKLY